jgi:hypothetical protein
VGVETPLKVCEFRMLYRRHLSGIMEAWMKSDEVLAVMAYPSS